MPNRDLRDRAGTEYDEPHVITGCGQDHFACIFSNSRAPSDTIPDIFDPVFSALNDDLVIDFLKALDIGGSVAAIGMG